MKPQYHPRGACPRRACGSLLLACLLLLLHLPASAQPKAIRLRTETITTQPVTNNAARLPQTLAAQAPATGLYLVQLEGHLAAAWRTELLANHVELLKYVPDDAFIARFTQVSPNTIRALSFVRWVGPYRPDHKIHPRLAAAARAAQQTNQTLEVNVLVPPGASPAELATVRAQLGSVAHESRLRQGTIVRGTLPPSRLDTLAQSGAVLWLEAPAKRRLVDEAASKIVGGDDGAVATPTLTQQLGFTGAGVTVSVADTGLDTGETNSMHPDLFGRVKAFLPYGSLTSGADGYGHGTHVAGIVAGNAATGETDSDTGAWFGLGIAPEATLIAQRIFDDHGNEANPLPSDDTLTRDAVRHGAQVGCNSWGSDVQGQYDLDASQFDELVRDADPTAPGDQPYILEFSAGNAGPDSQTVGTPATGKNVLTTGASQNVTGTMALAYGLYTDGPETMADFSSRGACEDGRIKPDVVAPGSWIASLASGAALNLQATSWSTIDDFYVYMGGTSMSGPYAAGAAAVFVQYYQSLHQGALPSPALVKAALINSAVELDVFNGGPGPIPNNDEGWGRITLTNIIVTNFAAAPRFFEYVDQTSPLTSGQVFVHHTFVQHSDQPLKITLAYTDVAGFPGALPALVNDLDLEVVAPDGTLYRGNQFAAGESVANAPTADNLNNVEAVHLPHPIPGDYQVRVFARQVVEDARLDTAAIDQDFALVISGDLTRPGRGIILLDRASYSAPDRMQITVIDPSRAASNSLSVLVKSTTEPAGETCLLRPFGNYGAFTGAVATVVGPAIADGRLQLHTGDALEADYLDSAGQLRVATALADLFPPALSGVAVSIDLGVITISWQTSEPANAIVRYSTNLTFNLVATDTAFTTNHSIKLSRLVPGQTYYFYVSSADPAGNTVTNTNAGQYFSFVAVATPTVLLVDAYDPVEGSPVIEDGTYTNALAGAGFSFGHWKISQRGSPQLADLRAFPVVIWRVIDDIINYGVDADGFPDPSATNNTLSAQQQVTIQNYLNGGGSFFMASMGILTQLGDVAFRKNVLQVAGFKQNPDPPSPCAFCDEEFGVPAILGAPGNPITSGISMGLDYSAYPSFVWDLDFDYGPDFSDTFTPGTNAAPILFEAASGKPCGMSYPRVGFDSPGRVVFLSFPLDAVPMVGGAPNSEVALLRNSLQFLVPGANGTGSIFLDHSVYSIPDQVTVEVGDSDLVGQGQAQVTFTTSSGAAPVTITLKETTHPGLFRGAITLVSANPTARQLLVRNGDTILASYLDASHNTNVVASAAIDTVLPVISQVGAATRYGDAVVSWLTSKPADSLVQFGESVLLGRTAHADSLATNHAVALTGLTANRTYYYQVVSRDNAGNTTIDNNQGALYSFSTRKAPQPPWTDDLEAGPSEWTVVPDPDYGSAVNWSLGTPGNTLQTSAHSGTNAWGSNLRAESFSDSMLASSFLYSPTIDLSGLSQATLTFWTCYDFSSGLEQGQLLLCTNSATPPSKLPLLVDFSGLAYTDWVQETVDLTPYVGQTIQVVWDWAGVDIGLGAPPAGWLIDDVVIIGVASGGSGTIIISKNLSQGTFTLNGPVKASGKAPLTTITNAPPGPYTVQFGDVAFYQTPLTQSNLLTTGGTLTFTAGYVFLDANHNGISDAWEDYYFGAATTNRTQFTDTDADGMSDYAEFIAGTNPTNAASKLFFFPVLPLTNHLVPLQWAAIPGRRYQVETSSSLKPGSWMPATDWLPASSSPMTYIGTNSGSPRFYRIQVQP